MYQYTLEIVLGVVHVQYSTCIHEMTNIFRSKQKQIIIFFWKARNRHGERITSMIRH